MVANPWESPRSNALATSRPEVVLPVAVRLAFLASDFDGDDSYNSGWTDGYVFPNGSGDRWTCLDESTETEPDLRQMIGANSASATYRENDGKPMLDLAPGVNGILNSIGTNAGQLDWLVADDTDCEVIVCVRPGAFAGIGGVVTASTTNQMSVMHDMRPASPERLYQLCNQGGTNYDTLPAANTMPTANGISIASSRWKANDRVSQVVEDGTVYDGDVNTAAVPETRSSYLAIGAAFIGYYKAGVHAVLLFDSVLDDADRLNIFAQLRARFGD